ncbi:Holliday junction resolvase [Candidatus Woesearchaeota archaeon]|nr:Holliday junction resolvase [Candidatus Woesearchaeota archaeon]
MSRKSKGISAERELIHLFWGTGSWAAIRVAGSGAIKYPVPDVLAANNLRKLAIECKSTKGRQQHLDKDQIDGLREFAQKFGTETWIGVRFNNEGWRFLSLEDLKETPSGYSANFTHAEAKGLSFDELVGKF